MACALAPWSVNTHQESPCDIVTTVYNSCPNTTNTTISPSSSEDPFVPVSSNATLCTCSWASYNLLSACMYCATNSPSLVSWDTWIKNCNGLTSTTTYFPWDSGIWLPSNTSIIPYYASYNPSNYSNGTFDKSIATDLSDMSKPDLNGSPITSSSSSPTSGPSSEIPVGPIVGGVVGGMVLLILLCGFCFFIIFRKRRRAGKFPHKMTLPILNGSHFAVATQDSTIRTPLAPSGYPQTSAAMSTSSYAIRSNNIPNGPSVTSLHSLHIASPTSAGHAMPISPLAPHIAPALSDAADVITPFLAIQPSSRPSTPDRKNANSHGEPAQERAVSPQSPRSRMNPPPYTPSSPTSSSHSRTGSNSSRRLSVMRHFRRESGSGDTSIQSVMGQRKTHSPRMHSTTSAESARSDSTTASAGDNGRNVRTTLERTTTTAASNNTSGSDGVCLVDMAMDILCNDSLMVWWFRAYQHNR
ncbi:uncharacterized protein EDB93DRAFT_1107291 [Suillus bovinus]|uniref:uncharacterized protein n=1 Tax=Suillus bovinus TaxID=48563 RepID=UPI001B865957|nr:uncharacterized protein EDB93DRAFT_1107291 [Suillus bovinus]KAG2134595.1 hypothetical protein EDB93DRAFT_1107291 [Suillus bovinus]